MILQQILGFLRDHEVATVDEIARALDSTPDAARSMLETLQRKGRVYRYHPPPGCGSSCRQCANAAPELYRLGASQESPSIAVSCAAEVPRGDRQRP